MTRQRFIVAAGVIGLVVLTVVLFLGSLTSTRAVRIDSFQRSADPKRVIVNVTIGLGDELAERSVDEDERTVRVTVRVKEPAGPRDLLGIPVPVVVSLKRPLEDRVVLDHDGNQVRDLGMYSAPGPTPRP
jgi:hypothetical protein